MSTSRSGANQPGSETNVGRTFADGWRAELTDDTLHIINPEGQTQLEQAVDSMKSISAIAHPTDGTALIALRTCTNRDGNICDSLPADPTQNSDESDAANDEVSEPPTYIEPHQFDMTSNSLTPIEIGASISIATVALDSGWLTASINDSATDIITISGEGDATTLGETLSPSRDVLQDHVYRVGDAGLAFIDTYEENALFLLTDDELQMIPGTVLNSTQEWKDTDFAILG